MLSFFFFYYYGDHRDLHSFPTRRSSDLALARGRTPIGLVTKGPMVVRDRERPSALRSEEHTSELQSRFDLVCRLLLEKKKGKNTNHQNCFKTLRMIPHNTSACPAADSNT